MSDVWRDMVRKVLSSLPDGSELKIVRFAISHPKPPSFLDRLACTDGRVNTLLDFVQRIHFPRFGFLLSGKRL